MNADQVSNFLSQPLAEHSSNTPTVTMVTPRVLALARPVKLYVSEVTRAAILLRVAVSVIAETPLCKSRVVVRSAGSRHPTGVEAIRSTSTNA